MERDFVAQEDCWAGEYLENHTDFRNRMVGSNPIRGCVPLVAVTGEQVPLSSGKVLFVYLVFRTF
jgi:hypothetical protein